MDKQLLLRKAHRAILDFYAHEEANGKVYKVSPKCTAEDVEELKGYAGRANVSVGVFNVALEVMASMEGLSAEEITEILDDFQETTNS